MSVRKTDNALNVPPVHFAAFTSRLSKFSNFTQYIKKKLHDNNNKYNIIQYAADFVIYNSDKGYDNCISAFTIHITEIEMKINRIGFRLTKEKSDISIFTRHNIPQINHLRVRDT